MEEMCSVTCTPDHARYHERIVCHICLAMFLWHFASHVSSPGNDLHAPHIQWWPLVFSKDTQVSHKGIACRGCWEGGILMWDMCSLHIRFQCWPMWRWGYFGKYKNISIFYHFPTLIWFLLDDNDPSVMYSRGCWWPGDGSSQGISNQHIDFDVPKYFSFRTRRIDRISPVIKSPFSPKYHRHPVPCPWGWDMHCLWWNWNLGCLLHLPLWGISVKYYGEMPLKY